MMNDGDGIGENIKQWTRKEEFQRSFSNIFFSEIFQQNPFPSSKNTKFRTGLLLDPVQVVSDSNIVAGRI